MATDNEVRARIIDYAFERFMKSGFSKVTLDEISLDLGMSKKTLYKYFQSKEELLHTAIHSNIRRVAQVLDGIVSSDSSFEEKLARIIVVLGEQMRKLTKASQHDIQRFAPDLWKDVEKFRREQIFVKMGRLIKQAREENVIRPDTNDQVLLLMLLNSVQGILVPEVLSENSFSAADAIQTIFQTIFEGALTDEARKHIHPFASFEIHT